MVNDNTTAAPLQQIGFATPVRADSEVVWAFTQVGVDTRLIPGWFSIPGGLVGDKGTITFYNGEELPAGFVVQDVELIVRPAASGSATT